MRTAKTILVGLTLAALMVPLAHAIYFSAGINFVASHGGNVTTVQDFQATSLSYRDGLTYFTDLIWGGVNQGNFGFDSSAGVNMTVTSITSFRVQYTVAYAIVNTTMVARIGLGEPAEVTGGTYTYDPATEIVTVTPTAPGAILVTWTAISAEGLEIINAVPSYIPLLAVMLIVFAAVIVMIAMRGELDISMVAGFIIVSIMIILTTVIVYRFIEAVI